MILKILIISGEPKQLLSVSEMTLSSLSLMKRLKLLLKLNRSYRTAYEELIYVETQEERNYNRDGINSTDKLIDFWRYYKEIILPNPILFAKKSQETQPDILI
jgi:acyl-CoA reductase-like NAD-dependent aldehyde dehydrogenase